MSERSESNGDRVFFEINSDFMEEILSLYYVLLQNDKGKNEKNINSTRI